MPSHMFVPDASGLVLYIDVFGVREELVDICQRCDSAERRDTQTTARPIPGNAAEPTAVCLGNDRGYGNGLVHAEFRAVTGCLLRLGSDAYKNPRRARHQHAHALLGSVGTGKRPRRDVARPVMLHSFELLRR
jgi:hypothetical protein